MAVPILSRLRTTRKSHDVHSAANPAACAGVLISGCIRRIADHLEMQLREDGEYVLNIDCRHIHSFDTTLYSNLVNYPCEVTSLLDSEARSLLAELTGLDEADLDNLVVCTCESNMFS